MVAEEYCSGERGAVTKGATTARARIRFCPRNVFDLSMPAFKAAQLTGLVDALEPAVRIRFTLHMHTHETYSRALLVWYSTCREPRPSQPRPMPTWRRWTTIRRGAQAQLLRDTSACSRVASAWPHETDAYADTPTASVGGAPRWRRRTGPREAMSSQPCECGPRSCGQRLQHISCSPSACQVSRRAQPVCRDGPPASTSC